MANSDDVAPQNEIELETVPAFVILKRGRILSDPLESKLDCEYVLGHLTNLAENQILMIRDQVSQLAFNKGCFNNVIARADSFDANNQARRLELMSMAKDMESILKKHNSKPEVELLWPHRLALVVQEMASDFQKENSKLTRKKNNKKLGRKAQYDSRIDNKIAEAWSTKQHKTYLDLAEDRGEGETSRDIRLAIDRDKKRKKEYATLVHNTLQRARRKQFIPEIRFSELFHQKLRTFLEPE